MPLSQIHTGGIEADTNCECQECLGSPSKKSRRAMPFEHSPMENQPIVKGNNRYGAKGTIRCLACQRRKGKCEFPTDKPELPCEHCKRRGLRCGDKLPTERKRQLNQSQDDHPFIRSIDASWPSTPTSSQSQYHYTEEPRSYGSYGAGVAPRPVAPAIATLPEPRPTMSFAPRPYHPGPISSIPRAQPPPPPQPPLFPQAADLVRLIEGQIAKISLPETVAVALCLGTEHGLVGNPYITRVTISRKNQEFSKGDSWFSVQWYEMDPLHRTLSRSINLRYEPGRQVCTSYSADDGVQQSHSPHQPPPTPHHPYPINIVPRQDTQSSVETSSTSPMDLDPPKQSPENADWSVAVGELFDKAAVIVDDQGRQTSEEKVSAKTPEMSTALWPRRAWISILSSIWGQQISKSDAVYTMKIPHGTIGVVVERCKEIVNVFLSSEETHQVDVQQFINHPAKKRISLKTLAKVLSHFSKAKKPQNAGETMQVVEDLVKTEAAMDRPSSPRKRGIEEVEDYDHSRKVKTERSWSHGSHSSHTTTKSSVGVKMEIDVKMEIEDHHAIDEETSNAASILNGVSMDRRTVDIAPSPIHTYPAPFWSQGDQNPHSTKSYPHPNNTPWLYNSYPNQEMNSYR